MRRKTVGIVAGVVVAVVVVVVVVALLLQPGIREIRLEAMEFGFNGASGGPTIRMRAGETVKIIFTNKGAVDHEFTTIRNKDSFLRDMHGKINELQAKGLDEEEIEESEEVEEVHHEYVVGKIIVGGKEEAMVVKSPGEAEEFLLRIDVPGTYTYLCAELDGTFPDTHADRGMFGTIVVE